MLFLWRIRPVLLLLLHWWRRDIIQRLGEEARHSKLARRLGKREKGLASYLNAAAGAVYLVGAELLQFSVRAMSGFEAGRKVVAILLRREVEPALASSRIRFLVAAHEHIGQVERSCQRAGQCSRPK